MRPYSQYKPAGVPWLGDIPGHWKVDKVKFLARLRREKFSGVTKGTRYVGMEHVLPRVGKFVEDTDGTQDEAESTVNVFKKDDVLFGKLRPYLAKCVVADTEGVCSSEFLVLEPYVNIVPKFLNAAMLLDGFIKTVDASTYGAKMPRADWSFISQLRLPVPPLDEQQAIANYLEHEISRIDNLMREKDGMIGFLEEARGAAFAAEVSKYVSQSSGRPSSHFPWIISVPTKWSVMKVKHLTVSIDQGISPQCESYPPDEGQWGVLKVGCVNSGEFNPIESKALPSDIIPIDGITLNEGDVLVSRANTRNLVGRAAMANRDYPRLMMSDKLYRLKLNRSMCEPAFLVFVLTHPAVRARIAERATGASPSMLNIDRRTITDLAVPLPPLDIQKQIIHDVQLERLRFTQIIKQAEDDICLLKELRAATIADAVLGRIDVRTVTAQ